MMKDELAKIRQVSIKKVLGITETGRKVFIRCPFHKDRTASFVIYPDNSYHCFGCNVHGKNAIDFMLQAGATFTEATKELEKYT